VSGRGAGNGALPCSVVLTMEIPFGIFFGMKTSVALDKAGRVVLPKPLRDRFGLRPGDTLDLEIAEAGVVLKPRRFAAAGLVEAGGRRVWSAPGASAGLDEIEEAVARGRADRDRRAMGL